MTDLCPECQAPMAVTVAQRYLGKRCCRPGTIACVKRQNVRLRRELAEARAIGEQSRITKVEAAMLTDAMRYPDNGALHCRWCSAGPREGHESRCWYAEQVRRVDAAKQLTDRLSARAATGEPKGAT